MRVVVVELRVQVSFVTATSSSSPPAWRPPLALLWGDGIRREGHLFFLPSGLRCVSLFFTTARWAAAVPSCRHTTQKNFVIMLMLCLDGSM
jgi:hypothetical protein